MLRSHAQGAGDTGLVETLAAILCILSAPVRKTYWYTSAESQMMQERSTQLLQTSLEKSPLRSGLRRHCPGQGTDQHYQFSITHLHGAGMAPCTVFI